MSLAAAISKRLDAAWAGGGQRRGRAGHRRQGQDATWHSVLADRQGGRHGGRAVLAGSHGAGDALRLTAHTSGGSAGS